MKKKIFIVILFLFAISKTHSQKKSGIIFYGHKIGDIAIDTSKIGSSDLKNLMTQQFLKKKKMLRHDVDVYQLQFSERSSLFEPIKTMVSDANPEFKYVIRNNIYFFDRYTNVFSIQKNSFGSSYVIEYNNSILWEITNESSYKHGFKCFKATSLNKNEKGIETIITAWFTKSIPLQLGPLNYNGLPGLIVELSHMENIYYLRKINYENVIINEQLQGQKITLDKYNEMIKSSFGL